MAKKKGKPAAPFNLQRALELREQNKTLDQIGEAFGLSRSTIHAHLKKAGHTGTGDTPKRAKVSSKGSTGKRKSCKECRTQQTINEKNFGKSVKSPDGFMHICRDCMSVKQIRAQAAIKKRKALNSEALATGAPSRREQAAGLGDAQRALSLANMGMPDTDGETLWLLRGAAMAEGLTVIELVHKMLAAYRSQR